MPEPGLLLLPPMFAAVSWAKGRKDGRVWDWIGAPAVAGVALLGGLSLPVAAGIGGAWWIWRCPAWDVLNNGEVMTPTCTRDLEAAATRHAFALAALAPLWRVWWLAAPLLVLFVAVAVGLAAWRTVRRLQGHDNGPTVEALQGLALGVAVTIAAAVL